MPHDDYEPLDVAGPADLGPLDLFGCLHEGISAGRAVQNARAMRSLGVTVVLAKLVDSRHASADKANAEPPHGRKP
jgi:hypothetical protein